MQFRYIIWEDTAPCFFAGCPKLSGIYYIELGIHDITTYHDPTGFLTCFCYGKLKKRPEHLGAE